MIPFEPHKDLGALKYHHIYFKVQLRYSVLCIFLLYVFAYAIFLVHLFLNSACFNLFHLSRAMLNFSCSKNQLIPTEK